MRFSSRLSAILYISTSVVCYTLHVYICCLLYSTSLHLLSAILYISTSAGSSREHRERDNVAAKRESVEPK
jgi:hypothetical protein